MGQEVRCPFCSATIPVPEGMAGKAGTCPACGKAIAFPDGATLPGIPPVRPMPHRTSGWKLAGIVIGVGCGAMLLVGGIMAAILLPALSQAQESARRTSCLNNIRQIDLAMIQYAGDSRDDEFPSALKDDNEAAQRRFAKLLTQNYLNAPKVFHCPSADYKHSPAFDAAGVKDIADRIMSVDWCSYGVDPKVQHVMSASRATIADRPDPAYWGPESNGPGPDDPKGNSANHKHKGQNVAYNDGHVKWSVTCSDDSGIDPNIYANNPRVKPDFDSNIRYGTGPNTP